MKKQKSLRKDLQKEFGDEFNVRFCGTGNFQFEVTKKP
jgi:hypothetical protein